MKASRASSSQTLDVFMTLLSLGKNGYLKLCEERKDTFQYLKYNLNEFAIEHQLTLQHLPSNPISLALFLNNQPVDNITKLGSMLYTRGISGTRVVAKGCLKVIDGYDFKDWGGHGCVDLSYLTAAASLGLTKTEVDVFIKKLEKVWKDYKKLQSSSQKDI